MGRRLKKPHRPGLGKQMNSTGQAVIPDVLPNSLAPFAEPAGASIYKVALAEATPEHVRKVEKEAGPVSRDLLTAIYRNAKEGTQNSIWLWLSLAGLKSPGEIPPEAFEYLIGAADKIFAAVVEQVCALEHVQITPGKEIEEGIANLPKISPATPDLLELLALSRPGRNLIQAAGKDLRNVSLHVAVRNHAREKGVSLDQAYNDMALAVGRISPETGASAALVRHFADKGKKLVGGGGSVKRGRPTRKAGRG